MTEPLPVPFLIHAGASDSAARIPAYGRKMRPRLREEREGKREARNPFFFPFLRVRLRAFCAIAIAWSNESGTALSLAPA
jgi:hypothetical protein